MALSFTGSPERARDAESLSARLQAYGLSFEDQIRFSEFISNPRASLNYFRGRTHFLKGRYEKAVQGFDRAIKVDPNLAVAYTGRGLAFAKLGQNDRALADCELAVELGPREPYVHLSYAALLHNLGRTDDEITACQRAISAVRPSLLASQALCDAYLTLGHALRLAGRHSEAVTAFERLNSLRPDDPLGFLYRGQALVEGGRYHEAIEVADQIIAVHPTLSLSYIIRGTALALAGYVDFWPEIKKGIDLAQEKKIVPVLVCAIYYTRLIATARNHFYNPSMTDAANALMAAAERYGLPKDVVKAIGSLAADAWRETTERAEGEPRPVLRATVREDKTLGRLARRYEERLASIELPADGFTTRDQVLAAARLSATYRSLRDREIARGLKPSPKDKRVVEAERLRGIYERAHPPARVRRKIVSVNRRVSLG